MDVQNYEFHEASGEYEQRDLEQLEDYEDFLDVDDILFVGLAATGEKETSEAGSVNPSSKEELEEFIGYLNDLGLSCGVDYEEVELSSDFLEEKGSSEELLFVRSFWMSAGEVEQLENSMEEISEVDEGNKENNFEYHRRYGETVGYEKDNVQAYIDERKLETDDRETFLPRENMDIYEEEFSIDEEDRSSLNALNFHRIRNRTKNRREALEKVRNRRNSLKDTDYDFEALISNYEEEKQI